MGATAAGGSNGSGGGATVATEIPNQLIPFLSWATAAVVTMEAKRIFSMIELSILNFLC